MLYSFISAHAALFPFRHSLQSRRPGNFACDSFLYFTQNFPVKYSSEFEVNAAVFLAIKYVSRCLYGLGGCIPCSRNLAFIFFTSNDFPFCVNTISASFKS